MAFQMIPPRVSSSPPPLDSLPTIICEPEDDDDDFGNFCGGHNASFDITGLSDKLPPTPASSPTKTLQSNIYSMAISDQPNERITEDSINQDSGVSTENQNSENLPKLPSDNENIEVLKRNIEVISNVNGEHRSLQEITEEEILNNDDFGDFECFSEDSRTLGNKFQESVVEESDKKSDFKDEFTEDGAISDTSSQVLPSSIITNAQEGTSGSENSSPSRSTPVKNSNNLSPSRSSPPIMVSPPPLDMLAPRCMLEEDEDEFGEFATGHPDVMEEEDDEFGDFTSTNFNSSSTNRDDSNTIISSSKNLNDSPYHKQSTENQEDEINEINSINSSKEFCSEQLETCVHNTLEKSRVNIEVEKVLNEDTNSKTAVDEDWQSADSRVLAGTEELSEESLSDERLTDTNQIIKNSSVENNIEIDEYARTLQLDGTDELHTHSKNMNTMGASDKSDLHESFQGKNKFNGDDVDDDFGDFSDNYLQSNEVNDDGDDFDDFVSPENTIDDIRTTKSEKLFSDVSKSSYLVNEVETCSNLNPSNVDDDDDFGDFDSARRESLDFDDIRSQVVSRGISDMQSKDDLENEINDNDFGDFENAVSSRDSVNDCDKNGTNDFNGFGDFTNADFDTKHDLDDDEFGDFNTSIENENFGNFISESSSNNNHITNSQSFDQKKSAFEEDKSPLVRKLESLLLRWIPTNDREEKTTENTTKRLHQIVKEDAFIWHQLEDLDSSPALNLDWPQSHVHKLFLASVNVDARNILFGQKWSSSVPLFAQTLTFSPLTPAKHIESTGECLEREEQATKCHQPPPEEKVEESTTSQSTTATGGETEDVIPEAKFDWTSSGLTNPLDATGLEREFLSENSSSGVNSGGRLKAPPSPSPLVQQILSGSAGSSLSAPPTANTNITPITSLKPKVQEVIAKLPDLSFMKSRVLMFPIRGEQ